MKAGRLMVSKLLDSTGDRAGRSERIPTDLIVRETCGG
jgi:DNA-binding LacI/PurR family transcriptional regulator